MILSFVIFSVYLFAKDSSCFSLSFLPSFLLSPHPFFFCIMDKTRGSKVYKKKTSSHLKIQGARRGT
jgi:hypothetical protein